MSFKTSYVSQILNWSPCKSVFFSMFYLHILSSSLTHPSFLLLNLLHSPAYIISTMIYQMPHMGQKSCRAYGKHLFSSPIARSSHWPLILYPSPTALCIIAFEDSVEVYYRVWRQLSSRIGPRWVFYLLPVLSLILNLMLDFGAHNFSFKFPLLQ